ncbi:MAG: hypothetical protein HZC47_00255 [Methanobacterium sp.]|uniref:FmdE family protein n=1 Tax=Methanobacterium sp. TaxID=2164 RepID=UPI003D64C5AE|nr:hypothetical protein [Methanobacterium sp.]
MISIKKQKIKGHIALIVFAVLFTLCICGTASAEDLSTVGGENKDLDQLQSSSPGSGQPVDPIIGVKVNYEYPSDNGINPEIKVKDVNGAHIDHTKTYDNVFNGYKLSFIYPGAVDGTKFNITVSAPGYIVQTKQVGVSHDLSNPSDSNLYGNADFNMQATANYKLGREVTAKADQILNFAGSEKVLAITTAGVPKINGKTSQDCIEGILNGSNGKITYGKGNLLMLRQTAVDPVDFLFVAKNGNALNAVCFRNGSIDPSYIGTISENMSRAEWNNLIAKVGGENAYSFASLANAWNNGAPSDLLREAAFHGHVCQGTISGYTITQALLNKYPPIQETAGGPGSPNDITSYKVIGVPGDSDDDAVMYFLDATPGKSGYVGFNTSATGAKDNMIGFIRWNEKTNLGDLIVMRFKREENQQEFKKDTGISLTGDLETLKFNTWILGKLKDNPLQLVEFIKEKTGLTEQQYYYMVGTKANITNTDGTVRIPAQEAHGLDINYMNGLNLADAGATPVTNNNGQLTYDQMKGIGENAANLAKKIFKDELGIDLEKDNKNMAVLTSSGYVHLNGQTTEATWDGIYQVLGSRLSRSTLLPIHMGLWKPLWFDFVLRGIDGQTMSSIYMRYDPSTQSFVVGNDSNGHKVNDIGPNALNTNGSLVGTPLFELNKNVFKDGNFGNVQSIANAWRNDPPFDQLMAFIFHNHACPGVQPGFFITDYIQKNYPLTGNQSYFYMGSSIYCKDDSLVYLLGVSPGQGTYMNQRLLEEETASEALNGATEEGIFAIWDPTTKTARVLVINFKWADIYVKDLATSEARREAQIAAYISIYKGEPNARVKGVPKIVASNEKLLTESEFNMIKQGGTANTNALDYVKGLPIRTMADLFPNSGNSQGNTSKHATGKSSIGNGSLDDSGVSVGAVTQTEVTSQLVSPGSQQGAAYEVSKVGPTGSDSGLNTALIFVGVILCGGLLVLGFFRKNIFGSE